MPAYKSSSYGLIVSAWMLLIASGCGTTKSYTATEQLLMSDAVDATIAKLDFSPLTGNKVYLDVTYVKTQKSPLLIDSDYVISSLRQQMVSSGVYLVEARDEADLIAEARMGALGLDGHNVTYGLPASSALASASSAISGAPALPVIPEISFARREAKTGAAKIAVFAYDRETREPFWQSGISKSSSSAHDTWVLGTGPWQRGTIYEGTRFAGRKVAGTELLEGRDHHAMSDDEFRKSELFSNYRQKRTFLQPAANAAGQSDSSAVVLAGSDEEVVGSSKAEDAERE